MCDACENKTKIHEPQFDLNNLNKGNKMKFWEAMQHLQLGAKIRCSIWPKGEFFSLNIDKYENFVIDRKEISSEWELYEHPKLRWEEVLSGLKKGKKYRRDSWGNPDWYICVVSGEVIGKDKENDNENNDHNFQLDDFEGNDWVQV